MPLDVFQLCNAVVSEYRDYVQSFVQVLDPRIDDYVKRMLAEGKLWPDAVLQLNPAFERDQTLGNLAADGTIMPETARFFGEGLRLYRHQREAIKLGLKGEPYVVTTGTGSGKSLTYLIPIYDAIIRNAPERHSVRALLIYPMNALINSQLEALREFQKKNWPDSPVRFDRYTGQEREHDRERILQDPPHILLTNYVMAEYILLRPNERPLLSTATRDLQTLVMDELHFYRGRQGADVAMLTRRLQEHAGKDLQTIATSATIVTGDSRQECKKAVADLSSRFFGRDIPETNIVDETLRRVAKVPVPSTTAALRASVETPLPVSEPEAVSQHPFTAWVEEAFGLTTNEEGQLIRRAPETFDAVMKHLEKESGLPQEQCKERLLGILKAGQALSDSGQPILAFRLHQWLSSGGSVYATLEDVECREFTMDGQYKVDEERVLFPLAFCRECGQEYYLVSRAGDPGAEQLLPRSPMVGAPEEDTDGEEGFFALEDGNLWAGSDDELPESWFNERRSGRVIKPNYAGFRPVRYRTATDGSLGKTDGAGVSGWFLPRPLLICLRCRAVYDKRSSDYRKLSSLSQTGRSTATTIAVNAAVSGMAAQDLPTEETKCLSFTDNRQDASLQAGHLNDFVQVALLRAGVVEALKRNGQIGFDQIGLDIFEALELRSSDFLQEPVDSGPGFKQGKRAMIDLLEYRALEDLSRGWRITQPNLEQTGLLRIEYYGLSELAKDEAIWENLPAIGNAEAKKRQEVLKAFLDHLRMNLAIEAESLTENATRRLASRASQWLRNPWRLEDRDRLRGQGIALLPGIKPSQAEERRRGILRLGSRSAIARYLRSSRIWNIKNNLSAEDAENLVRGIVTALKGHLLSVVYDNNSQDRGVRLLAAGMRWAAGEGNPAQPDPVRTRSLHLRREIPNTQETNTYFTNLYKKQARQLRGMLAAEHTGQVITETRVSREEQFRNGVLSALFCSPTMELGVDIRNLDTVHLRNVPPTPANYAQRSGRAGRGGHPALIVAFAAQGNAHDQYYFVRRNKMIAGAVAPARMDLRNQELVKAHLYSTWLAVTGIQLGNGMADILDLNAPDCPIAPNHAAFLTGEHREHTFRQAVGRAEQIIKRTQDIRNATWFSDHWIEDTIRSAPEAFNRAFERWRELYQAACALRDEARRKLDDHHASHKDQQEAERREAEAQREIDLLLNRRKRQEQSDFYPYRYLASEGFLPGYNFPRLPVRASVRVGDNAQMIDRPRFLGLTEFGPGNLVYHEGRKHRVYATMLPPAGIEGILTRARLCNVCGYAHDKASSNMELCEHCGKRLDAATSDFPQRLLAQPMMRARSSERISSEEEERVRSGYHVTTHFNLAEGQSQQATVHSTSGECILDILYASSARLWRINHGWRRGEQAGFVINPRTGDWGKRNKGNDSEKDPAVSDPLTGVKLYVQDFRNILLLKPCWNDSSHDFQTTLLHAIKRAVQFVYQVEDQEIGAELIGQGEHRRMLFWEAAEGGIGVWERLVSESRAFSEIAHRALHLCHFEDPADGTNGDTTQKEACAVACYECLLTYSNQREHRHIDRRLIRDYFHLLASATTIPTQAKNRDESFQRLEGLVDPNSSLERKFLRFLYDNGLRLPDEAQNRPAPQVHVQPDFYYNREDRPGVCVFVDGPHHDSAEQQTRDSLVRNQLQDYGYRVIAIRYDCPFAEQAQEHSDVFGLKL